MNGFVVLLVAAVVVPLLLAIVPLVRGTGWAVHTAAASGHSAGHSPPWWHRAAVALTPWAAAPALAASLLVPADASVEIPWLLLGAVWGLDDLGRAFLVLTAALWLLAGVYLQGYLAGDPHQGRFCSFYLLTMSGNLGLCLARDVLSFYLFFTLMSLAAYGLVTHTREPATLRAGRVYMALVVIGEVLLFAAILIPASRMPVLTFEQVAPAALSGRGVGVYVALILVSFGIKVGVAPLHVWLPLAHPAAPTPASAVLSGAIIKAGLLGWLRFLPLGQVPFETAGAVAMALGLATAYYGVAVGLFQSNPKTVLAYSSVSQMGIVTVVVGAILAVPASLAEGRLAIVIYAMHHALAKGALFLGVGIAGAALAAAWRRWLVNLGLLLPALALAGAPITSGAVAKLYLKTGTAVIDRSSVVGELVYQLLPLTAVGTTLLMGRFLVLTWRRARRPLVQSSILPVDGGGRSEPRTTPPAHETLPRRSAELSSEPPDRRLPWSLWVPWAVLLAGVVLTVPLWPWEDGVAPVGLTLSADALVAAVWPVAVGVVVFLAGWAAVRRREFPARWKVPEGDLLLPVEAVAGRLARVWSAAGDRSQTVAARLAALRRQWAAAWQSGRRLARLEATLGRWESIGALMVVTALAVVALLAAR